MTSGLRPRRYWLGSFGAAMLALAVVAIGQIQGESVGPATAPYGQPSGLPLPSSLAVADFERSLFAFLNAREYRTLGWRTDKGVRDTGPYIDGKYYGTHPAVRIYYSPEIIEWLLDGKRKPIPDGAMIVKEQFQPPAARYVGIDDDDELFKKLSSWTVMVKDSAGSHDGWFWSNPAKGQEVVNNHEYPFPDAISGFGIYCIRCHGSAKSTGATNEYTFASLRNIAGFSGEPLVFQDDGSWRDEAVEEPDEPEGPDGAEDSEVVAKLPTSADASHPRCSGGLNPTQCAPLLNNEFLDLFPTIAPLARADVLHLPPVTHDWVVRRPAAGDATQPFVTSNQCMSCHAGLVGPLESTMFVPTTENPEYGTPGVHLSPYGEWRWTPMGLAGRDPVFFAQLESEVELIRADFPDDPARAEQTGKELVAACLQCHGAMGKRQFALDHGSGGGLFGVEHVMRESTDPHATGDKDWRYGALARDGISCTVCHQMEPREQPAGDDRPYLEFFLETSITGNFNVGAVNELQGPFEDKEISPYAMEHAMGFKPKFNAYVKSSQLCGTCHVVNLPILDRPEATGEDSHEEHSELIASEQNPAFKGFHHHVEQATYLEWLNSEYENELDPANPKAKTCQDCHMDRDYHNDELAVHLDAIDTRIAAIQDNTYPEAESLASHDELEVRRRPQGYARHNFRGLNMFLLEMFNQFDDILGVRKFDFMTGSTEDIPHAKADFVRQARNEVATVEVDAHVDASGELVATVDVHNKTGHRFPTGVGFRRAFVEFVVTERPADGDDNDDAEPRVIWSSGRTNSVGVLVDADGAPLPCEFFNDDPAAGKQAFQPHHDVITSPGQVQIYESLLWSTEHRFTTSFVHGTEVVKDNRLLPRGWKKEGPGPALNGEFLRATYPCETSMKDPRYVDGSGSDQVTYRVKLPAGVDPQRLSVTATLYYQAIPPYFLRSLFTTAPAGPATQRLHYLCSNMDLRGTPIENWKLAVTSASTAVEP